MAFIGRLGQGQSLGGRHLAKIVFGLWLAMACLASPTLGCSSLASRKAPRISPAPVGVPLDPPPPSSLIWLRFASAQLPSETADGRAWDEGGGLPDAYAVLSVDGEEALRTVSVTDSLTPVWAGSPGGNFELTPESKLTIRIFDGDGLTAEPIGETALGPPSPDQAKEGAVELDFGRGVTLRLVVEEAHALMGLGFQYTFASRVCRIVSRFEHGPAGRAGMSVGDTILTIEGLKVQEMSPADLRGKLLSVPMKGIAVNFQHQQTGATELVQLVEGPIYPLYGEHGSID